MRIVGLVALVACSSPAPRPAAIATPAPPAVRSPDPAPPAFRLPGDVVPVRYRLEQTIVPSQATAAGVVHIDATVRTPTRVVWLNATDITVGHAEVGGKPARVIAAPDDFVGLAAATELPVGPIAIDVTYTAGIDKTRARGLYAVQEADGASYAYTFFEAIDARRAFPCFDEPAYKIPWTLVFQSSASTSRSRTRRS